MKVTKKKLKDYLQDQKNFNRGTEFGDGLIEKSVSRFGAGRSMLASSDGVLIAGNKSHQKLSEAGIENVIEVETDGKTAVVVKRTDIKSGTKKFHELALADNATSKANLNFDETLVEEILTEEVMNEWGIGTPKAEEDDFEAPPLEEIKTDIVRGDIFEITDGKLTHRLLCGDSTMKEDVEKLLNGNKPNLMITDPPYGVSYDPMWRIITEKSGFGAKIKAKGKVENDDRIDWTETYSLFPGNITYIWHGDRHARIVAENLLASDFDIVCQIIWAKPSLTFSRGDYHWQHEPCWYAHRKGKKHDWIGGRKQTTVWNIAGVNPAGRSQDENDKVVGHSTQKPVECMARPIRNHSGDVYDPFGGSGTTMVASHQLGRNCYMIEIMPAYCQIILDRILKLDPSLKVTKNGKPFKAPVESAGEETPQPPTKGKGVKTAVKEAEIKA